MPTSWGCALSSTAAKTPPSHPRVIHRSTRGRGSPSKNITGLKTPAVCKKRAQSIKKILESTPKILD